MCAVRSARRSINRNNESRETKRGPVYYGTTFYRSTGVRRSQRKEDRGSPLKTDRKAVGMVKVRVRARVRVMVRVTVGVRVRTIW